MDIFIAAIAVLLLSVLFFILIFPHKIFICSLILIPLIFAAVVWLRLKMKV